MTMSRSSNVVDSVPQQYVFSYSLSENITLDANIKLVIVMPLSSVLLSNSTLKMHSSVVGVSGLSLAASPSDYA